MFANCWHGNGPTSVFPLARPVIFKNCMWILLCGAFPFPVWPDPVVLHSHSHSHINLKAFDFSTAVNVFGVLKYMWDVLWSEFYQIAPKLKVLLSLYFPLALPLVAIAQGHNKEVANMGFSSKILFLGAQPLLTFSFLMVLYSPCPFQWPHSPVIPPSTAGVSNHLTQLLPF